MRFATIGTSQITDRFLTAAKTCGDFRLEAVYSRSAGRAEKFAERHQAARWHDSLEKLAEDPGIDAVYVASPNFLHARQAILLMEHGKHVLCEKALASNQREAEEMFRCAEENGVLLLEAMRSIHDPGYETVRSQLHKIGTVRQARFSFCKYSSKYDGFKAGKQQNIFDPACSAGALMDIGIYCVEVMVGLFGEPESLSTAAVRLRGGIDGAGVLLASYPEMIVEAAYSKIAAEHLPSVIQGEAGSLYMDSIASPGRIWIRYLDGEEEVLFSRPGENNMAYETETFIRAAEKGEKLREYRRISEISLKITDEARKQAGIRFPADGDSL